VRGRGRSLRYIYDMGELNERVDCDCAVAGGGGVDYCFRSYSVKYAACRGRLRAMRGITKNDMADCCNRGGHGHATQVHTHTHTHRDQQRSTKCVQQLKKVNGGVFLNFEKKTVKSLSKNVGLRAVLETKSTEPSVTVQINTHAVVCKWLKELRTELPNSTFAVQVTQSSCDLISKD